MKLSLFEHPEGVETQAGPRVVYDIARNEAHFGAARVEGPALRWELGGDEHGSQLSVELWPNPGIEWLVRCDRVDFPPGGVAYLHKHPGPGIRRLLFGAITIRAITIESLGQTTTYGPGEAWFESGPEPVFAAASPTEETAFVRVMILPREWAGKRTIRYVNEEDEDKPKTQRATVFLDEPITFP